MGEKREAQALLGSATRSARERVEISLQGLPAVHPLEEKREQVLGAVLRRGSPEERACIQCRSPLVGLKLPTSSSQNCVDVSPGLSIVPGYFEPGRISGCRLGRLETVLMVDVEEGFSKSQFRSS